MTERERWDWEREHSVLTPEGQIEASGAFGRGLGRHRAAAGRFFLAGAIVFGALAVIGIVRSL